MLLIPDERISQYVSTNEKGEWIHDPNMPEELMPIFDEFVLKTKQSKREWKNNMLE